MANITATEVKQLRDLTGAGMMDSKKALQEADGDVDAAIEVLRVKGASKAAQRAEERTAAAGMVAAAGSALVQLNCETDFVAKNEDFIAAAEQIAEVAHQTQPADIDALSETRLDGGQTVGEYVHDLSARIGEKIALGGVACYDGQAVTYLHRRASDLPPAVGVLVEYDGDDVEAARGAAMQVAAMRPHYVRQEDVPEAVVAKEREIAEATAREEGKPESVLDRIIDGRVKRFFKDAVLVDQPSVVDDKQTVQAVLDAAGISVRRFARFEVEA